MQCKTWTVPCKSHFYDHHAWSHVVIALLKFCNAPNWSEKLQFEKFVYIFLCNYIFRMALLFKATAFLRGSEKFRQPILFCWFIWFLTLNLLCTLDYSNNAELKWFQIQLYVVYAIIFYMYSLHAGTQMKLLLMKQVSSHSCFNVSFSLAQTFGRQFHDVPRKNVLGKIMSQHLHCLIFESFEALGGIDKYLEVEEANSQQYATTTWERVIVGERSKNKLLSALWREKMVMQWIAQSSAREEKNK